MPIFCFLFFFNPSRLSKNLKKRLRIKILVHENQHSMISNNFKNPLEELYLILLPERHIPIILDVRQSIAPESSEFYRKDIFFVRQLRST